MVTPVRAEVAARAASSVGRLNVRGPASLFVAVVLLPVREEEQLVLDDRPAEVGAELAQRIRRASGRVGGAGRSSARARSLVVVVAPARCRGTRCVPDLMTTLIAAPPAMPCSALKELVTMLTSSMASDDGHVGGVGRQPRVDWTLAPSSLVLFCRRETPLTLNEIERCGLPAAEFCSPAISGAGHDRASGSGSCGRRVPVSGSSLTCRAVCVTWMSARSVCSAAAEALTVDGVSLTPEAEAAHRRGARRWSRR